MSHPIIELGYGKILLQTPPTPEGKPYRLFFRPLANPVKLGDFNGPQEDIGPPIVELVLHGENGVKVLQSLLTKMLNHSRKSSWEVVKEST